MRRHALRHASHVLVGQGKSSDLASAAGRRALEAQALRQENQTFLILAHLGETYDAQVRVLQSARDHLLKEEALEHEVLRRTHSIRLREEEIAMRLLTAKQGAGRDFDPVLFEVFLGILPAIRAIRDNHLDEAA